MGLFAEVRQLSSSVTQRQLEAAVTALCCDPRIDGVLLQLPLPRHIDEEAIIESFDPQKDVDGFHPLNMGGWLKGGGQELQGLVMSSQGAFACTVTVRQRLACLPAN